MTKEKSDAVEEKKKVEEEKCKSDQELQFALQWAKKAEQQRLELEAKVHQLEAEL